LSDPIKLNTLRPAQRRPVHHGLPTTDQLLAIPRAAAGEYELTDKEVKRLRARIYGINKDNAAGWKFRTLREGPYLMVWRIH